MDRPEPSPGPRSLRAPDALNVALADARDGLGPYPAIFLATKHRDPSRIGLAMATMAVASASLVLTGLVVPRFGSDAGFVMLSAIAAAALAFHPSAMPETRPEPGEVPEGTPAWTRTGRAA